MSMKPAYLFSGTDSAKLAATRARPRARAEAVSGATGRAVVEPSGGRGCPDAAARCAAIRAMSLVSGRRYLLVDGVEKWRESQAKRVVEAMAGLPAETTLVLVAHGELPKKVGPLLTKAVKD